MAARKSEASGKVAQTRVTGVDGVTPGPVAAAVVHVGQEVDRVLEQACKVCDRVLVWRSGSRVLSLRVRHYSCLRKKHTRRINLHGRLRFYDSRSRATDVLKGQIGRSAA